MQSNNPIFGRAAVYADHSEPMTIKSTIHKSVLLTMIAAIMGLSIFWYALTTGNAMVATVAAIGGAIGGLILGLIVAFRPHTAPTLSIPFALLEGAFLGGVSVYFQQRFPGVPLQALLATFVTSLLMFVMYNYGIIKATEKFKAVVMSATLAIFMIFAVQWVMSLAFSSSIPYLFEGNGLLALGFAAFVAIIASLNLILDFDLIENSARQDLPKYMEWFCAFALLSTLVWMYFSFLRLIGIISSD